MQKQPKLIATFCLEDPITQRCLKWPSRHCEVFGAERCCRQCRGWLSSKVHLWSKTGCFMVFHSRCKKSFERCYEIFLWGSNRSEKEEICIYLVKVFQSLNSSIILRILIYSLKSLWKNDVQGFSLLKALHHAKKRKKM